jgi:hypothetical protein
MVDKVGQGSHLGRRGSAGTEQVLLNGWYVLFRYGTKRTMVRYVLFRYGTKRMMGEAGINFGVASYMVARVELRSAK